MEQNVKNTRIHRPIIKPRMGDKVPSGVCSKPPSRHYEIMQKPDYYLPSIKSPQVHKPMQLPVRRNIGSVDSAKRQEASRRLVELYKAYPMKSPVQVNIIDNKENGMGQYRARRPPLPVKYERLIVPHYAAPVYVNPMKQVGRAVLERPHYHVLPQWWG